MRGAWAGAAVALGAFCGGSASGETLRATYAISLLDLPIGTGTVNALITSDSYQIDGSARLNALARLVNNSHGASRGRGALVGGHVSPLAFSTVASNSNMTRTIRMAIRNNAVAAIDISPPFGDSPDRVPLKPADKTDILDPVGAYLFPAPKSGEPVSAAACDRTLPIFDGYTRFNLKLSYVGQEEVKAKGYSGKVAVCSVRFEPIAGHRKNRPAIKYMEENKDIQIWLAPIEGVPILAPYRISIKTQVGTLDIEATEFSVSH
jgi:hypothetical protein